MAAAWCASAPQAKPSAPPVSGTCRVAIWVRSTGVIQAAQVVVSSGAARLDEACAVSVINLKMIPATIAGEAIDKWVIIPIKWEFGPSPKKPPAKALSEVPMPKLADDQELHVDPPYYPPAALQQRKEGVCTMHAVVSASGDVEKIQLTKSTGFNELDTACLDAMYAARFIPAQRDGQNIAAATDVWLAWRLPQ
jgi:TonB family protein